jgi:hypothetical protein
MSYILTAESKSMAASFSRSTPAEALAKFQEPRAEGHDVKIIGPDGREMTEQELQDLA